MNQPIVQYCQGCGKPLNSQARFCGRCGKAVPPPPSQSAPPEPLPQQPRPVQPPKVTPHPQTAEIIVAALPAGNQRSGLLGMKSEGFVLVLTNVRILFAKQTSELMKENARLAKETAKQSGKGFFSQWGAVMGSSGSQRYLQMSPQQILNETPGNYGILNDQVRSAKIKELYDPDDYSNDVKLRLDTAQGKIDLVYRQTSKKELKQILQQTLGNRVR